MAAWLAASAFAGTAAHAADPWGGGLTLTSDYVFRGVSQSDGQAAAQADLHLRSPGGWFAGAWVSTANPPPSYAASPELDLYAGLGHALSDRWAVTLSAVRYLYPRAQPYSHYDATELSASLRWDDRIALSAAVAPDAKRYSVSGWSRQGQTRSYEASLRQSLIGPVSFVAALGYYDTQALLGESYRAWDGGLSIRAGPVELALLHFGVDAAGRRLFGPDAADRRWVFTAAWRF